MSILNQTELLKLTQFSGNLYDVSYLYSIYNSDMAKIDEYVGGIGSGIDEAIEDMRNDIATFEQTVNTTVGDLTDSFQALSDNVATYDSRLTTLETCCNNVQTVLTEYDGRLDTLEATVESLSPQYVADLRERLSAVEQKVDTNATMIASLNSDVNYLQGLITVLQERCTTIEGRISVNESDIAELKTCCETVQNTLISLQSQITSNDSDIADLQSRMSTAEDNIQGNAQDITTVSTQTSVNTSDIAELKEIIQEFSPSGLEVIDQRLTTLESVADNLGVLATKDSVSADYTPVGSVSVSAVENTDTVDGVDSVGTLPTLVYDSQSESLTFDAGTLPSVVTKTFMITGGSYVGSFVGQQATIVSE